MSSPLLSPEFETLYVGNPKDDDGQVIDSLMQEVNAPAEPQIEPISVDVEKPIRFTRLLSGAIRFDDANPFTAFQLLPADPWRKQLSLQCVSEEVTPVIATDYIYVADENGKVNSSASGRLYVGDKLTLDLHTGALWVVAAPAISGPIVVTYWSTTR